MKPTERRLITNRLRALVPPDVPVVVIDTGIGWEIHHLLTAPVTPPLYTARRFQLAYAWLQGYVTGYQTDHDRRPQPLDYLPGNYPFTK